MQAFITRLIWRVLLFCVMNGVNDASLFANIVS